MKDELSNAFAKQILSLAEFVSEEVHWPSPESAFAHYTYHVAGHTIPKGVCQPEVTSAEIERLEEAPVLASVGYLAAIVEHTSSLPTAEWSSGFSRLTKRKAFPSDRESFFFRPLELLGISLGASVCPGIRSEDLEWLRQVIRTGGDRQATSSAWTYLLGAYSASILHEQWLQRPLPSLADMAPCDMALILWLQQVSPEFVRTQGLESSVKYIEADFLKACSLQSFQGLSPAQAAILHISLTSQIDRVLQSEYERNWQIGRSSADALQIVRMICRRFEFCVRQLGIRQREREPVIVNDEYDVQDLMHALLRLHFDDVRSEEWTPSYAGSASRMDFLLKREQIVIETKMTRDKLDQRRVGEELIIDKEHYRKAHPDCKALVCFVYDPTHKCSNPAGLENDLAEAESVNRVEVIVEPQ